MSIPRWVWLPVSFTLKEPGFLEETAEPRFWTGRRQGKPALLVVPEIKY